MPINITQLQNIFEQYYNEIIMVNCFHVIVTLYLYTVPYGIKNTVY